MCGPLGAVLAAQGVNVLAAAHGGHEASPPPPPEEGGGCTIPNPNQCQINEVLPSGKWDCSPPGCAGAQCIDWRPCAPSAPPGSGNNNNDTAVGLGVGLGVAAALLLLLLLLLWCYRRRNGYDSWSVRSDALGPREVVTPPASV